MKLNDLLKVIAGLLIAFIFLSILYKSFPIGVALAVTGGCLATLNLEKTDRLTNIIGRVGSLLYPIGIVYSFFKHGILWGLISIVLGFLGYKYAKQP